MGKTLESIAKSVKNTARGIGKYLAVSAAIGSSYFGGNKAYADGPNPATECALSTVVCVSPVGDWVTVARNALNANKNVYFTDQDLSTTDLYVFPNPTIQQLFLNDSRSVYGENRFNTILQRDGSGIIYSIIGNGSTVKDMELSDAWEPIKIGTDNYDNVTIQDVNFKNSGAQPISFSKSEKLGNSAANINLLRVYVNGGQLGIHFNAQTNTNPVTLDTKYPKLDSCTFTNIKNTNGTGLVIDAPYDITNNIYKVEITNSTMNNSDGNWTEQALIVWSSPPPNVAGSQFSPPTKMIEWNITGETLVDAGIRTDVNREANNNLNLWGRPRINLYVPNPSFNAMYTNGRNAALEAAFDENGDNHLTPYDLHKFRAAFNSPSPNRKILSFHDDNKDGTIDLENDFTQFWTGYEGPTNFSCSDGGHYRIEDIVTSAVQDVNQDGVPDRNAQNQSITCQIIQIPATSIWGQIILLESLLIAGTLTHIKRRNYT